MSFWSTEDGEAITPEKEYSAGGGNDFAPLPKNTNVLVAVEDIGWKAGYQISQEFVNLKVRVLKPEGYANRVLFFKLWVDELDPGVKTSGAFDKAKAVVKRDKHKRMIMTIDANAKGKLAKMSTRPTDEQLALALTGAQFVATLGLAEYEVNGEKRSSNWLQAAAPKATAVSTGPEAKPAAKPMAQSAFLDDDDEDSIPF